MGGCQRHVWSTPALELCHRAGMGKGSEKGKQQQEEHEDEEGCASSSSWAGDGAAPGSEHHLQPGKCRIWVMQDLGNQHRMVRREGRERCPPLWKAGLGSGSSGCQGCRMGPWERGCLWGFRQHKQLRELLGSWGESACAEELWSLCLCPFIHPGSPSPELLC